MRSQDNFKPKNKLKILFLLFIVVIVAFVLFSTLRVTKFSFTGDTQFTDERVLKILSLTYLKDNPMLWLNKDLFEKELKSQLPQVKNISYSIVNSETLGVSIVAEDICCVISDSTEKRYVLSSEGVVLREYDLNNNSQHRLISINSLKINDRVEKSLVTIIKKFITEEVKVENIEENLLLIEDNYLFLKTKDDKKILLGENTDLNKLSENYKSMKSYLEQNAKNYSILDFRFEKIIVK